MATGEGASMTHLGLLAGYVALAVVFVLISPIILIITIREWWEYLTRGPAKTPFVPESPESFARWSAKMEQGRRIQEREER